ncbi:MAG: lipopolysaccharide assembly protein LapB [Candidatus Thiodiazotropha sp. (ex Cardiolucina cf. quadrata)]|nr:lipopolysaccharide assembly protein LapB [Candidatus Thiodiazotropha sp. (ex Lucinoma borealis)]MCU7947268.1 lipopolysaccharide assembly protein LapB [Candidatus Thiodiazotropha sp. (ex Cardiolucina cf. quadrata)]
MLELLLLLLPVAAASGWYTARRGMVTKKQKKPQEISPVYFKGLNYLLNEQPDKAIDLFIELLDVDSDTVETHLALGNLFRRRGEVDRAIRIHQNLIARPSLSREQRAQALLELGQDYMRAGLFDRAENLFLELTELRLYNEQAYVFLLEIYQQEKDWLRCLEVAEKITVSHYPTLHNAIAHFYCELAEQMLSQQNIAAAEGYLKRAQQVQRSNVRALLLQGEIDYARGDCRSVVRLLRQAEVYDPAYLSEVLPRLVECYRKLGLQQELFEYLQQLYERHHCTEAMLILSEMVADKEGESAAVDSMLRHLEESPDLKGLERLVRLNLQRGEESPRETLEVLLQSVMKLLDKQPAYQCEHCGFTAKKLHWHCPSCKTWGEIKPQQGLTRTSTPSR